MIYGSVDESRLEGRVPASASPPERPASPTSAPSAPVRVPVAPLVLVVAAIFAFGASGSILRTLRAHTPPAAVAAQPATLGAPSIR